MACCMCQCCTSNLCPCTAKFETISWRLHASELGKKTLWTCRGKHFLLLKKLHSEIYFFVKLFFTLLLSTVEPHLPDHLWDRHGSVSVSGVVMLASFALELSVCSNWCWIFKCYLIRASKHNLLHYLNLLFDWKQSRFLFNKCHYFIIYLQNEVKQLLALQFIL